MCSFAHLMHALKFVNSQHMCTYINVIFLFSVLWTELRSQGLRVRHWRRAHCKRRPSEPTVCL